MSGELTEFEQKSALIPKQTPYAILGGAVLALILFILVSIFGKNEAVDDLHNKAKEANAAAPAASTSGSSEDLDI